MSREGTVSTAKLPVLVVHNLYQQSGGEDEVVRAESEMLRARGHDLREYCLSNKTIDGTGRIALLRATLWNSESYRRLTEILSDASHVGIAHFHNTFPLISPAAYYAMQQMGVPVIQTLHNYRLLCPSAALFREGAVCEQCLGRAIPWPGVVHACYRGSRVASTAVASMLTLHRALGTWTRKVDVYIALTEFARRKFIEGGLPPERILVKPNFAVDHGAGRHDGEYALFVGRLAPEKGLDVLVDAWNDVRRHHPTLRLKVAGTGPLEALLYERRAGVEWLGWQSAASITELMKGARLLIVPSTWYEGFPMTIVEAYATGLPVVASGLGSLAEIVREGLTGRLCRPGDARDLANVLVSVLSDPDALTAMQSHARREYETKYTPQRNYEQLTAIYRLALQRRASVASRPVAALS